MIPPEKAHEKIRFPFFSVITTTHNRVDIIPEAIDSVLRQTFEDYEIIIVDNGSTDGTDKLVAGYGNPKIQYKWQENSGSPGGARNTGIKMASGEFVCFLDSDDWWYPEKLAVVFETIKNDSGCDLVTHLMDIYKAHHNSKPVKVATTKFEPNKRNSVFDSLLLDGNHIAISATVVKRKLLVELGGLSEDSRLLGRQDYDLWLRMSKITDRFVYLPVPLTGYRTWEENLTQKISHIERLEHLYNLHKNDYKGPERNIKSATANLSLRKASFAQKECMWKDAIRYFLAGLDPMEPKRNIKTVSEIKASIRLFLK